MIHHQCRPVRRKHNGAVVCRAQSCRRTVVIVVIYCPPRGRIVSGVWVSASFQIIPRLVGRLGSEVRVSVCFQSFALRMFVTAVMFFAVLSVIPVPEMSFFCPACPVMF